MNQKPFRFFMIIIIIIIIHSFIIISPSIVLKLYIDIYVWVAIAINLSKQDLSPFQVL
jgi:uncharacterized protein (DUF983 family)